MTTKNELCSRCGKREHMLGSKLCFRCAWDLDKEEANREWGNQGDTFPEEQSCVMCGIEYGTAERSDGKFYCSRCWMIWTS